MQLSRLIILLLLPCSSVLSAEQIHNFVIDNQTNFDVELSSERCNQLPLPLDQLLLHKDSKITLPMSSLSTVDCAIGFSRGGTLLFSMLFINGHAFLHGCKNKRLASQPGYVCELITDSTLAKTELILQTS